GRTFMRKRLLWFVVAALAASGGLASAMPLNRVSIPTLPTKAQARTVDPIVLTGAQFPAWSAGPEISFREPQVPTNYDTADVQGLLPAPLRSDCYDPGQNPYDPSDPGDHNCDQSSRTPIRALPGRK